MRNENIAGIAIFTTEALVKKKVSETRAKRLLRQCEKYQYSTVQKAHLKRHIQISRTEGQNQKCEERKLKLVLSLTELSAGERQKVETNSQRERSHLLERI